MSDYINNNEREELHKSIWSIADDLRGAIDGWDFKNFVLGTMFYRFISEAFVEEVNTHEKDAGNEIDYALIDDEMAEMIKPHMIDILGYFIYPSELFWNVVEKAPNDENLNETLKKIFNNIENSAKGTAAEHNMAGLFDDFDTNNMKLGKTVALRNKRLVKLLNGVASMKLGNLAEHKIDAFGDAYEYLMNMYASNAGKSGGEFFTPQCVSELVTKLALGNRESVNTVYDPACGSGSLLLQARKILGNDNIKQGFYGQEINVTTYNLCRINMFLHGVNYISFNIENGDTLTEPMHKGMQFDMIVSNPPYSIHWEGKDNSLLINDERFAPAGVLAPKTKADLAFVMHILDHLTDNGSAAIVSFPGIFYRGGTEQKIRKYLVDNNFVDAIIQLPENLFYGTTIATDILVLKKNKATTDILFIDASKECVKATNNNIMTNQNIKNVLDLYKNREEVQYKAKPVQNEVIEEKKYTLSVSTYVEQESTREEIDIKELNKQIAESVKRQQELREEIDKLIAELEQDYAE